jgi:hypothetical protein
VRQRLCLSVARLVATEACCREATVVPQCCASMRRTGGALFNAVATEALYTTIPQSCLRIELC